MRIAQTVLVGKPEWKRLCRTHRHKWEDDIKVNIREIGFGMCIGFIRLRIVTNGKLL
jgi:hypothetical protein